MKYLVKFITLLLFTSIVFAQKTSAIVHDKDDSFQKMLRDSNSNKEKNQSREEDMSGQMSKEKERNPSSYDMERNDNFHLLKHARPPLYDRKYK